MKKIYHTPKVRAAHIEAERLMAESLTTFGLNSGHSVSAGSSLVNEDRGWDDEE